MQREVNVELHHVFQGVREELDDHLDAVNNNTNEIETNHEMLCQIMDRLDKLSDRLDSMALHIKKQDPNFVDDNLIEIKPLRSREKEVFSALYELNKTMSAVTYKDLAKKLGTTISMVQTYITALVDKGVPIQKQYTNRKAYLSLKKRFKRIQAKNNIIGVDSKLTAWM